MEHQAHACLYLAYLGSYLLPCAPALAFVDQAVAALMLPSNNIELAGGVPEPRAAGAAGTADGRAPHSGQRGVLEGGFVNLFLLIYRGIKMIHDAFGC